MKDELNRTVDVLQLLTNKISTLKQKTNTLLSQDDYSILTGKVFQLQQLLSGSSSNVQIPTDDLHQMQPRFEITVINEIMTDDYVGQYYDTGSLSPANTKLYRHVNNSNFVGYFIPDEMSFAIYKETSLQFGIPHCNPDDQSLPIGDEFSDGVSYKLTIIG